MSKQQQFYHQNNAFTLWMGDIEEFMDERFIKTSFNLMGIQLTHVKVVRNRLTGQPVGYGFVSFESDEIAQKVLREFNGQQIPNASDGKRFRLNNTSNKDENEFSIYVGDLSPEVDDYTLLAAFAAQYPSTCSAKVMVTDGQSRRFGFVRFSSETDYRNALTQSNNLNILGSKAISVRAAKPRRPKNFGHYKRSPPLVGQESVTYVPQPSETPETVYASEVNPYYSGYPMAGNPYNGWFYGYLPYNALQYGYYPDTYGQQIYSQPYYTVCDNNLVYPSMASQTYVDHGHNQYLDTDKLNDEMIAKNEDLYESFDNSHWSSSAECDKETKVQ